MTNWRLVTDDGVSASFGLAADETLAVRVGAGESVPTLRLYSYRSHCALVGRFQNLENEIHLNYCRSNGIAINRRPTGGGAILMGAAQLGVALTIPSRSADTYRRARELMAKFSGGIVRGLASLGIQAEFRRKNDIEVDGRKIVGLGIFRAPTGGLLFHASLLIDLDVPLMLRALNTPFEKISDKQISTVAARISTVRRELEHEVTLEEVRRRMAEGYAGAFSVALHPGEFTHAERREIARLEQEKYLSQDWVAQRTEVPDTLGTARVKTPAGLLDVRATLAGRTVKSVFIGGDFFAADNAIADLEASLRWHTSEADEIRETIAAVYERRGGELDGLPRGGLNKVVLRAIERARASEAKIRSDPYGCFVSAGAASD